jgi:hypothetical protein
VTALAGAVPAYAALETPAAASEAQAVVGPAAPKPPAPPPDPWSAAVLLPLILGSAVLGALLTLIGKNLRDNAVLRRDKYAAAVGHLAAWAEYPYRIRRRTSDDPETMTRLANLGHQLQIDSACHRGWVAGESTAVAGVYDAWLDKIQAESAAPLSQAWQEGPVTAPAGMVLNGFGPPSAAPAVTAVETALSYRFGLRRLMWPSWVARRLSERGLYPPDAATETEPETEPTDR